MAITAYRQSDRILLSIHDVTFKIKPLSYTEKTAISKNIINVAGTQTEDVLDSVVEMIRYCVKDVTGISYIDGTPIKLAFEENGHLKDSSIDELMSLPLTGDLTVSLFQFMQGIPDKVINSQTGEILKHIKVVPMKGQPVKKK